MKKNMRNKGFSVFALILGIVIFKFFISLVFVVTPTPLAMAGDDVAMAKEAQDTKKTAAQKPETVMAAKEQATADAQQPFTNDQDMALRRLEREKNELEILRNGVDGEISELEIVLNQTLSLLEELEVIYSKKEKHLVKILSGMPAKKAAPMIDKLEMDLIVKLFSAMKSDKVGKILPYLTPEKAAKISENLACLNPKK